MGYAFAPQIEAVVSALAAQPAALLWAAGWLAAAFGFWLRVVMPVPEEELELATVIAASAM